MNEKELCLSLVNAKTEELLLTLIKSISRICLDLAYSEALIKSIE